MPDPARPRLFALPVGVDYATALLAGLEQRFPADDPRSWARTTIFVNSGRMARRLRQVFDDGPARLLPRVRLVSDLAFDPGFPEFPAARDPLHMKLDLAELIREMIGRNPGLAPRAAVFDLAESLATLIDEMQGEGVASDALARLDVGEFAAHWQVGRALVEAAFDHFGQGPDAPAGAEARRRRVVRKLAHRWQNDPPQDPVIIAGSTGSRGATRLLMEAVARLPQGWVVLPGFDFDLPETVWAELDRTEAAEDHPQYRFRALMRSLELKPSDVARWTAVEPASARRNRVVSLALHPAPVTDRWRDLGPALGDPVAATATMDLVEAPTPRAEAGAIALRLRKAVADGRIAALISPDRMVTRRVTAMLRRWKIEPDDSAGEPLHQTAPGRFLRHVADLLCTQPGLPALLTLLKHPLTASAEGRRGPHLRWTRELELYLRRKAVSVPQPAHLEQWDDAQKPDADRRAWVAWLSAQLSGIERGQAHGAGTQVRRHLRLAESLAAGPPTEASGRLWQGRAGEAASNAMQQLAAADGHGGMLHDTEYADLLHNHLAGHNVPDPALGHPGVMIWGTLEARAQLPDLAILAGLNDGTWPDLPGPDPWLNRRMRRDAGLLLPDRRIGLAAHDFQQAIAAPEVMLTRALRDEDAETVPSRWLNRLQNLLGGLGARGEMALEQMRDRGRGWSALAEALDQPEAPVPAEKRPAPAPPLHLRPRRLSVTQITRLIRDPYAIYARHVLHLRPLDPLDPAVDYRQRGIVLHHIVERFLAARNDWAGDPEAARIALSEIARNVLEAEVAAPAMRALWHARLIGAADRFVAAEIDRLARGAPVLTEEPGALVLQGLDFTLTARPDRIDRTPDGRYLVYDYKSGTPPSRRQVDHFEKQLPLEAAMVEGGGFENLPPAPVAGIGYIAIGPSGEDWSDAIPEDGDRLPDTTLEELHRLITRYGRRAQGYTAIRAAETTSFEGDYDHLARYGEWDLTDHPEHMPVGSEDAP